MVAMADGLKRSLRETYLVGSSMLVRRLLGGRSGARRFDHVVIVAPLARQNGITRGAFLQWQALRNVGVDAALVDATAALRNPLFRLRHRPGTAYIFHSAGPQTASLIGSVLPHAANAYRIGYWAWELPDPPPDWAGCDGNLDEIWTPSRFSAESLRHLVRKPVEVVPHYLPPQPARRRAAGSPFTVLAMADTRSSLSRKNPLGAIKAFTEAFGASPAARLILKFSGRDEEVEAFLGTLGGALGPNVEVIRSYLDEAGLAALYDRADVLLSLHRAEGFGLPMLDALARGIPVVATAWSGNTDFTDDRNSVLVPYELVPVEDQAAIYRGSRWAEPDLGAAARGLRRLAEDAALYEQMAEAAHRSVAMAPLHFPLTAAAAASTAA
jgi:glycosyltransferase involved in cell wall biosynthesis